MEFNLFAELVGETTVARIRGDLAAVLADANSIEIRCRKRESDFEVRDKFELFIPRIAES